VNYAKLLETNFFLLGISFYKLAKHKICQVKFGKLLELYHTNAFSLSETLETSMPILELKACSQAGGNAITMKLVH
jgi:hypothetical protein